MTESPELLEERGVLGWYLGMQHAPPSRSILRPEHFRHGRHRAIWQSALQARPGWGPLDLMSAEELIACTSTGTLPSKLQLPGTEARIVERWARRHLAEEVDRVSAQLLRGMSLEEAVSALRAACGQAGAGALGKIQTFQEAGVELMGTWLRAVKQEGPRLTLPLFLPRLQVHTGGWLRGALYYCGACTSTHKTTFATQAAQYLAEQGERVFVWTMEDNSLRIAARVLARSIPWLDTKALLHGLTESKQVPVGVDVMLSDVGAVLDQSWTTNLRICSEKRPTLSRVIGVLSAEVARGATFAALDFFQLIRKDSRKTDSLEHVEETAFELQALAEDLGIPILVTVQPTQSAQQAQFSEGRPITMSDFRGGAPISQSAYGVFIINAGGKWIEGDAKKRWRRDPSWVSIHIAKSKDSSTEPSRFLVRPENDLITNEKPI